MNRFKLLLSNNDIESSFLKHFLRHRFVINKKKLKDIQAVKLKAERGFLLALARFNHCRREKQKTKLLKEKGKTLRKDTPKKGFKTNKSDNNPLSADISV